MQYPFSRRNLIVLAGSLVLSLFVFVAFAAAADTDAALLQKCKDSKAALLKDLETYVNIDSGSGYEPGLKKFQGLLIQRLKDLGADVKTYEVGKPQAGYNIVATFRGTGKGTILILGHADTVWGPGPGEAAKRPFTIRGDKAFGPGVSDEKGGLVIALYALQLLKEMNFKNF